MCGKTQQTQTNSNQQYGPPQQVLNDYLSTIGQAQGAASTAFNPATVAGVAGLNQGQLGAIGNIQNLGNAQSNPYLQQASALTAQGGQGITPQAIAQMQNPYTQQVIDSTLANINTQDQEQQSQLNAQSAARGALTGDRASLAQNDLARQQDLAKNQTIAGLENQGFNTAAGLAGQNASLALQGAYGFGNLGQGALSAAQQGLVASGVLQQQEQAGLNQQAALAQAQSGYPFQTLSWLANTEGGLGSLAGGTSNGTQVTSQPVNTAGQIAGLGLTAASLFNAGGAVAGRAAGGAAPGPYGDGPMPYAGANGYIPQSSLSKGQGPHAMQMPSAPTQSTQSNPLTSFLPNKQQMAGLGNIGSAMRTSTDDNGWSTTVNPSSVEGWGNYLGFKRGGAIPHRDDGGAIGDPDLNLSGNLASAPADVAYGAPVPVKASDMPATDVSAVPAPSQGLAAIAAPAALGADTREPVMPSTEAPQRKTPTDRSAYADEIDNNPELQQRIFALAKAEVGGQGPEAQQAFMETLFNRAAARGVPVSKMLDPRYYPSLGNAGGVNADDTLHYYPMLTDVLKGSNIAQGATDNASNEPGNELANRRLAAGRQGQWINGELFYTDKPYEGWTTETANARGVPMAVPEPHEGRMSAGLSDLRPPAPAAAKEATGPLGGLIPEKYRSAMLTAGLGMMASPSHMPGFAGFAQSVGSGGLMGAQQYDTQQQRALAQKNAEEHLRQGALHLSQQAEYQKAQISNQTALAAQHAAQAERDKYKVEKDAFGNPIIVDITNKSATPLNTSPMGTAAANDVHGDEFLKTIGDPYLANVVKKIAAGQEAIPTRSPMRERILGLVSQYDPSFDAVNYGARAAQQKNYMGGGKQYQELQAIGTVAGHLHDLKDAADKMDNFGGLGPANSVANWALNKYREASQDPRISDFNTKMHAVSDELGKAYKGGVVSEGEVKQWQQTLNSAQTPEQFKAVIGGLNRLLASKRQQLEDGYRQTMGKIPLPQEFSATSDRTRQLFNDVDAWSRGEAAGQPTAKPAFTGHNKQTGQTIYSDDGVNWRGAP